MCDGHLEMDYEDRNEPTEAEIAAYEEEAWRDESSFCELCGKHSNMIWQTWDDELRRDLDICPSCYDVVVMGEDWNA